MSSKGTTAVGGIVAVLIIGAVAVMGFYQFEVAPSMNATTTTTSSTPAVDCLTTPSQCARVTIPSGASSPPVGSSSPYRALYGYQPLTITVVIGVNSTVLWTNNDTAFHTATSNLGAPAAFDSGCMDGVGAPCPTGSPGSTFQFAFTTPGTYQYHCSFHPWMLGKVVVKAGSGTTTSKSTSSSGSAAAPVSASIVSGASTPYSGYSSGSATLYGYSPLTITVVIGVNNTVTWTNMDMAFHTVTANSGDPGTFDSGCLAGAGAPCQGTSSGSTFTFTFTVPGTYVYHCVYHPWMMGKVVVVAASA